MLVHEVVPYRLRPHYAVLGFVTALYAVIGDQRRTGEHWTLLQLTVEKLVPCDGLWPLTGAWS